MQWGQIGLKFNSKEHCSDAQWNQWHLLSWNRKTLWHGKIGWTPLLLTTLFVLLCREKWKPTPCKSIFSKKKTSPGVVSSTKEARTFDCEHKQALAQLHLKESRQFIRYYKCERARDNTTTLRQASARLRGGQARPQRWGRLLLLPHPLMAAGPPPP